MARGIPTIRAVVLSPIIKWMTDNRMPVDRALANAGLPFVSPDNPFQIIPLYAMGRLLANVSRQVGPDLPIRLTHETDVLSEAMIAPLVTAAGTPRRAFSTISAALPMLSSHEHVAVENGCETSTIRHFWGAHFDAETLHCLHQFVAAILERIVGQATDPAEAILGIEMLPHPEHGLDFLRDRMRVPLVAGNRILSARLRSSALDLKYRNGHLDRLPGFTLPELASLRETDLTTTTRVLIRSMLEVGTPTVDDLARAANLGRRSYQRELAREGTGFRELLDEVRRDAALEWLEHDTGRLAELALSLGYANASALTRAMHRWVGESPKRTRDRVRADQEATA